MLGDPENTHLIPVHVRHYTSVPIRRKQTAKIAPRVNFRLVRLPTHESHLPSGLICRRRPPPTAIFCTQCSNQLLSPRLPPRSLRGNSVTTRLTGLLIGNSPPMTLASNYASSIQSSQEAIETTSEATLRAGYCYSLLQILVDSRFKHLNLFIRPSVSFVSDQRQLK